MSHYTVAVIRTPGAPGIDELMAPYSEHLRVEPHVCLTRDQACAKALRYVGESNGRIGTDEEREWDVEMIARLRKIIEERGRSLGDPDAGAIAGAIDSAADRAASVAGDPSYGDILGASGETAEAITGVLVEFWSWCEGKEPDADGNFLTTRNPDARWDYYCEERTVPFPEWLASGTDMTEEELRDEWRRLVTQGSLLWTGRYYLDRYGDEGTFVRYCMLPDGLAVVTPDGEWHEPGRVGFFACDDATVETIRDWVRRFDELLVEPYDLPGTTVTMLDCHI